MAIKLEDAVAVVQKEICDLRAKYESVAKTEEQDPIMVEGETSAGYFYQLIVDPKDVAKILLEYDYPVWRVLGGRCAARDVGRFGARVGPRTCLLGGSMKARQKRYECPKCDKYYAGYPVLSREDNKTEICSQCGMRETIIVFSDSNSNRN